MIKIVQLEFEVVYMTKVTKVSKFVDIYFKVNGNPTVIIKVLLVILVIVFQTVISTVFTMYKSSIIYFECTGEFCKLTSHYPTHCHIEEFTV